MRWSKTQFSVDSISQIVKSEIDQSYDEVEIDNEKENNENENEKLKGPKKLNNKYL